MEHNHSQLNLELDQGSPEARTLKRLSIMYQERRMLHDMQENKGAVPQTICMAGVALNDAD